MRALDRKVLRDIWRMKGQLLAICLVMASGISVFVMSLSTLYSLDQTQRSYYRDHRFADVFAHAVRAPEPLAARIAEVPGVREVQTRLAVSATIDIEGLAEPALARILSDPTDRRSGALNLLHLVRGRHLDPAQRREVLVGEAFAVAHGLEPGDRLRTVLNGRRQDLTIAGIVLSPEYIFQIREGDFLPDDRRFAVLWMNRRHLGAAYDLEGAFNSVALTLQPGWPEERVIERLDALLERYGGLGAFGRSEQLSHRFVTDELEQLRAMATITPVIFLAVSAFLLNVVISRLIRTQREQIAILKAFGYKDREVAMHYIKLILLVSLAGALLGWAGGYWLGRGLTQLYTVFFRFPEFSFYFTAWVPLLALAIAGGAVLAGTLGAVRRAATLAPAAGMQPEPPGAYRPTLVERLRIERFFSVSTRMVLRELERRPLKSALSSLGIGLGIAVMILGSFSLDVVDEMIDHQFTRVQRQDITVSFHEALSGSARRELENIPGVLRAEPFRSVAARIRFEHRERRQSVLGLPAGGALHQLRGAHGQAVILPEHGLVLSAGLAEQLGAAAGDLLTLEILEGRRPRREVQLAAVVEDYTAFSAYMDLRAMRRLLREEDSISGAFLAVDSAGRDDVFRRLKHLPGIAAVSLKQAAIQAFEELTAENMRQITFLNVFFAGVIAFGVVYNSVRISLAERSRELATLEVLGFSRKETASILFGEIALIVLPALPAGLILGNIFARLLITALQTETQRFPFVIFPATYAWAVITVLGAVILSSLVAFRLLSQLDLVATLKARD